MPLELDAWLFKYALLVAESRQGPIKEVAAYGKQIVWQWWIPLGLGNQASHYVAYDLLAVLASIMHVYRGAIDHL